MKKLMTSTIILLPLLILAIMLVSGAIMSIIVHIYVEKVEFVKSETLVLVMKDENLPPAEQLQVNVFPYEADNRDVEYTVDDQSVASVDEKGVVTAQYFGETVVTVTSKENRAASAKRKILVTDNTVHAIKIKEFPTDLYRGDAPKQLLAEVLPYEANNKALFWSSSNDSVLRVTQSGDVTCMGAGTATITAASVEKPEIFASVTIRCHEPLESIASKITSVVTAKTTAQFPTLYPKPEDATYTLSYSSSDENVAQVDGEGFITFFKAGAVTITATAVDGRDHTDRVQVKYNCTNGYYMGTLFEKTAYSFDYDEHMGKTLDEIRLHKAPDGSYREIVDVSYSKEGIISFDKGTDTFRLNDVGENTSLGKVTVTISAKKYDYESAEIKEFITDVCEITLTRHAKSISFDLGGNLISEANITASSISLTEITTESASSGIGVLTRPMNHTDRITYSVSGDAKMKKSILVFSRAGRAVLTATAKDENGNETAMSQVVINYTAPINTDKKIEISEKTQELLTCLTIHENGTRETGVLEIAAPTGTKAQCTSDSPDIVEVRDGVRLVPKKGGFATVSIDFVSDAQGVTESASSGCKIEIYVDREVLPGDIYFDFEDEFTTSKESFAYRVFLSVDEDALEGKKVFIDGEEEKWKVEQGLPVLNGVANFPANESNATVSVSVAYNEQAERVAHKKGEICSSSCKVYTTHGDLISPPKVTADGEELNFESNKLHFSDLGEKITIVVDASSAVPMDFELKKESIRFTTHDRFEYEVKIEGNRASIVLTAKEGGEEETTLIIAGKAYPLSLDIAVAAHELKVKYGETELNQTTNYSTMLSSLQFTVWLLREDEETITDTDVLYSWDQQNWETVSSNGKTCTLAVQVEKGNILYLKSGKAQYTLHLQAVDWNKLDFKYHIEYTDEKKVTLDEFEANGDTYEFSFPKAMQGNFDICITRPEIENLLGGMDEGKMGQFFKLSFKEDANNKWSYEVSADPSKITVKIPEGTKYFMDEEVTFTCGEKKAILLLNYSEVVHVEMPGFNNAVESDVYRGYQQVRVFAKQSQYSNNEKVDYFRVPITATSDVATKEKADPASIIWELSKSSAEGLSKVITRQRGVKVIYNDVVYAIERGESGKSSTLKDANGTVIAQNGKYQSGATKVTWIDVYAEDGYAHIYFGDFKGLSESDVQNDYFGNFGDEEGWKKVDAVKDDGSGRTFTPSEGAYSYLRVEAGDGAKDSKIKTHFNFNVLDGADLVNVFDATGYLNNKKVVLHNNLYGPDESTEGQKADGQIINSTAPAQLGKDLIFGNGYQVNFQALNAELVKSLGQQENTGKSGVSFGSVYNVTIKGTNPTDSVDCKTHKIILNLIGAYYSDLQYYSKMDPIKGDVNGERKDRIYFKNTVMRYVANAALQLYAKANEGIPLNTCREAYFENVVIAECMRAITLENGKNNNLYFKGFFDVLNYSNAKGLQDKFGAINGGSTYNTGITEDGGKVLFNMLDVPGLKDVAKDVLEWFGSDSTKNTETDRKYYVNMICTETAGPLKTYHWKNDKYEQDSSTSDSFATVSVTDTSGLGIGVKILTFNVSNTVDGGKENFTSRDMNELFTDSRNIRLLCQYKTINSDKKLESNTEHILWHMQQVYRDVEKIEDRKGHIEDLKESLKGTDWPDGTGVSHDGQIHGSDSSAAQLAAMIGETVLPEKREYA